MKAIGFIADGDDESAEAMLDVAAIVGEPVTSERPFRFSPHYLQVLAESLAKDPNRYRRVIPPDWLFANRVLGGLYAVLGELGATADWRSIWDDTAGQAA